MVRRDPAIVLLAIGQTLVWASIFYVFPALLLRWEQDLGWSKASLTGAITLAVLVSALASPIAGRLIDRGHGAVMMAGAAALGGAGLIWLSLITEVWQFYAAWLLIGVAMAGCLYEPCFALVTRARGEKAKPAIILITLAAGFASTIAFPVVYSLSQFLGWRMAVQILSLIVVVFVAPVLWLGVKKLEETADLRLSIHETKEHARDFLRRPAFWLVGIGFACLATAHGATLQHLLPILDERGLSDEIAVLAASFIGPMQVAGRLAMMASEKHVSTHGVTVTAFFIMAASLVMLLASCVSPAFITAFVILFGSAYGTVSIVRPLVARELLGGQNFGAKSGALAVPYLAGAALAPYFGALLWDLGGYNTMLGVLIGFLVVGLALYVIARRLSTHA